MGGRGGLRIPVTAGIGAVGGADVLRVDSSMPFSPCSRPKPDCLTPPNGAAALEMASAFGPSTSRFPARRSSGSSLHSRSEQKRSSPALALYCGHSKLLARHHKHELQVRAAACGKGFEGREG